METRREDRWTAWAVGSALKQFLRQKPSRLEVSLLTQIPSRKARRQLLSVIHDQRAQSMQFPNPSPPSHPVISEEKSCRRIKFPCKTTKRREETRREEKTQRGRENRKRKKEKKRKIFQYKRNNYSARDTVMVKEWSKWSLLNFNTLFDHLQHSSSFDFSLPSSLSLSRFSPAPFMPSPRFSRYQGSLPAYPVLFLFFPFLFLSLSASRCPRNQPAKWSRAVAAYPWNTRCKCRGGDDAKSAWANGLGWRTGGVRWATIGRGSSRGVRHEGCPPPSPLAAWGNAKVCPGV